MAFAEALRPKAGSKHLSTIINAEGKEVQAETRYDELQKIKYEEIIDILIAAGYYRAKIKGLSEFDKVVGGICWCIEFCDIDLDVDILFQENSSIGQKIALTEKIVAVLLKVKCPFSIEPHQIQGLDFKHIHPVVEWLVKKSTANRKERGDYLQRYAIHQFNKHFHSTEEKLDPKIVKKALKSVKNLQDKYGTQRKYRSLDTKSGNTYSRVESTLFEYGHMPLQEDENEESDEVKPIVVDEERLNSLIKVMEEIPQDAQVGGGKVTTIVQKHAVEIKEAAEQYSILQAEMEKSGASEIHRLQEKESLLSQEKESLESKLRSIKESLNEIKEQLKEPSSIESLGTEEKEIVKKIEILLRLNQRLKEEETQFREQCKAELGTLQGLIKEADEAGAQAEEDNSVDALNKEVATARLTLAKTNRGVATAERLLDQVPSRAELYQYQRRFLELYNQVSGKHRETKQYYILYNTLNDALLYLNKELNLLKSILENYSEAMMSQGAKEQYMQQFEQIVDGVKQNKTKVEQRRNDSRVQRDMLKGKLQGLIDQQRLYAIALKEFTLECKKNQALLAQIKQSRK